MPVATLALAAAAAARDNAASTGGSECACWRTSTPVRPCRASPERPREPAGRSAPRAGDRRPVLPRAVHGPARHHDQSTSRCRRSARTSDSGSPSSPAAASASSDPRWRCSCWCAGCEPHRRSSGRRARAAQWRCSRAEHAAAFELRGDLAGVWLAVAVRVGMAQVVDALLPDRADDASVRGVDRRSPL